MIQSNLSWFGNAEDQIPQFNSRMSARGTGSNLGIMCSCTFVLQGFPSAPESDFLCMIHMAPMKRFVQCKMC